MIILEYNPKIHKNIIHACVRALKDGKVVAYPTDTCYGLAVDATNIKAIKKLYRVKGRDFNKPVHVVVPSLGYGKKITRWPAIASKLAKKFWPGALTLVLEARSKKQEVRILTASTGFLGVRIPKNKIAQDLSSQLKCPITATSANQSGQSECYSVDDILQQFKDQRLKPDIVINAGKLPRRLPSTLVKIEGGKVSVLRVGPISEKQILKFLLNTKVN